MNEKNYILSVCISSIVLISAVAFAEEPYTLDKIVVKANDNYATQTFSSSEIKGKNLNTVSDLLGYASGVDLRQRGPSGIQGDLTVRGSDFEQTAVLIDGIKVMDPQTGHHNLDIPLTLFDVERVEVIKEGASGLYGAGAFAGTVNIVTKKPAKRSFNLDSLFGQHALFGQAMSLSYPEKDLSTRVSFDHVISKAARPNTDFEYRTASFYVNKDFPAACLDTLLGYQKKDFGADSFYSNLFPEEEEHTQTFFLRTGLESRLDSGLLKNNLFFRKHRDKFILTRNNPTSVNYHTTYVYGLNSSFSLPLEPGELLLGADTGGDEINSTNLGKHNRIYEAASLGFISRLGDKLNSDIRLRLDHYQKWGWQESYNFGLGYYILDSKLKLKGSVSRAFRIPSFTELFYADPANIGNPGLKCEKSDNFRAGFDYRREAFFLSLEGFLRRGFNLIDWTRISQNDPWQATNLGRVDFTGVEFILKFKNIAFSYNYNHADKKVSGFLSKYALDILKHQFIFDISTPVAGLNLNWQLSYNQRYFGETYFVGNIYLGKAIKTKDYLLEPFLKIENLGNTKYTEIAGVLQPGRWIKSGLKFEW